MNELAFPVIPANFNTTYGASIRDPPAIGNGTYTSWPGGVDPSAPLYAGNPVPLSMGSTQSGGRRRNNTRRKNSRVACRKNRVMYRKNTRKNNRKASRKNRKNSRKNSRKNRKNSRKNSRKNRKNSRKNNRRN